MPRKTATPAERIAKIKADAPLAANAVQALLRAIDKGDSEGMQDAAKFLEAFGCYTRRTDLPAPAAIPTAPTTQRVVIVGPNLRDQSKGQFHVHAEGCADLKRDPNMRNEPQDYVIEASSLVEVGDDLYADMIDEGSMTSGEGMLDCHFAPCVKLPVK